MNQQEAQTFFLLVFLLIFCIYIFCELFIRSLVETKMPFVCQLKECIYKLLRKCTWVLIATLLLCSWARDLKYVWKQNVVSCLSHSLLSPLVVHISRRIKIFVRSSHSLPVFISGKNMDFIQEDKLCWSFSLLKLM